MVFLLYDYYYTMMTIGKYFVMSMSQDNNLNQHLKWHCSFLLKIEIKKVDMCVGAVFVQIEFFPK